MSFLKENERYYPKYRDRQEELDAIYDVIQTGSSLPSNDEIQQLWTALYYPSKLRNYIYDELLSKEYIVGLGAYWFGANYNSSAVELKNLNVKYNQLNDTYSKLVTEYIKLESENKMLKTQQKELTEQVSSYLIEQTSIDLLGLKKYSTAYDIMKIVICNKNPSIIFC